MAQCFLKKYGRGCSRGGLGGWTIKHLFDSALSNEYLFSLTNKYPTRPAASSDIFVSTEYKGISDHPLIEYLMINFHSSYKGRVFFKFGYPVGVFFKGCEIFSEKFKGCKNFSEKFKGCENFPSFSFIFHSIPLIFLMGSENSL